MYTIADCQFSKQEKEYLTSHSLQYEEKNLETNKDFLTEMLAISNNFAGTPVTRVEKDDGSIAVLKGFTKGEFDTTFGFKEEAAPPPKAPAETSTPTTDTQPTTPVNDPLKSVMDDLEAKAQPTEAQPTMPPADQSSTTTPPPVGQPTPSIPDFPQDGKTSV